MSSISSLSGVNPTQYARIAGTAPTDSAYEANSKRFGPVVASAIGAAEATGTAASSVVNISAEGLQKLGDAIESGYDSVVSGVTSLGSGLSNLAHEGVAAVEGAYDTVADAVSSAADSVSDAASSVTDTVSSAFGTVGQYAALGVAAGKQLISEVV